MLDRIFRHLKENRIIIALLAVFVAYLAYKAVMVILIFFIAFILAIVLLPPVDFLVARKFSRSMAVLTIWIVLLILGALFGYLFFPPLVAQLSQFVNHLPEITEHIPFLSQVEINEPFLAYLQSQIANFQGLALSFTTSFITFIVTVIAIIVLSIYLLADYPRVRENVIRQFGGKQDLARNVFSRIEKKMGGWLRGQLLLCFSVGILFLIAYLAVGLPAAIPLALLAAVFEVIPVIGPVLAAIPAALIALTVSVKLFLIIIIVYTIIQMIEGHVLAPRIMSRTAHLHSISIIFAFLVGAELAGFLGILLAVPVMLFLIAIYEVVRETNEKRSRPKKTTKD